MLYGNPRQGGLTSLAEEINSTSTGSAEGIEKQQPCHRAKHTKKSPKLYRAT